MLYGLLMILLSVRPVYAGDSERWTLFKSMNSVNDIECVDGVLWCVTDGGVLAWDTVTGSRRVYTEVDGLRRIPVYDLVMSQGDIWCTDTYGIYKYGDNKWEYLSLCPQCYNYSAVPAVDRNGLLWAVISDSLYCYRDDIWKAEEIPFEVTNCQDITFDDNNRLWIPSDGKLYVRTSEGWVTVGPENIYVTKIVSDNADGVWIISDDDLFHVTVSSWETWEIGEDMFDITIAPNGVPYVTTRSYLCRVENDMIMRIQPDTYDPFECPRICFDENGTLWYGQHLLYNSDYVPLGVGRFDGESWAMYTLEGPASNYIYGITQAPSGDIFFATRHGLSVWNGRTFRTIDTSDGLASIHIRDVDSDADGRIWLLAGNTLQHCENDRWTADAVVDLKDDDLWNSHIVCGHEAVCWIGTRNGLFRWNGARLDRIDYEPGISLNCGPITVDHDNRLWLAHGGVVSVFNGTDWTTYSEAEGLPHSVSSSLTVDEYNRIWCHGFYTMMFDGEEWDDYSPLDSIARSVYLNTNVASNPLGGILVSGFCTLLSGEWAMYLFDGTSYTIINDDPFDSFCAMDEFLIDYEGYCWYGRNGYGIVRFRPDASIDNESAAVLSPITIRGNYPNPFNSGTTINYELARDGRVDIDVFNTLGQLVTTVLDRRQLAGAHIVRWDGRSRSGPVSSGVYFARITSHGHSAVQPMTLMR